MLSEWTAECSHDAPTLVVPWSDATTGAHFIDLRAEPYDIADIPEVDHNPTLARALRSLNATRSPFLTAKCDVWQLTAANDADTLDALCLELMLHEDDALHGFASYIDILWRERSIFTSFHQHEQLLHRLTRHAAPLNHPYAMLDCVLRPALVDLTGPQEGFALSLYIKALGHDPQSAEENWASALDAIVGLVRSKDLSFV
jgi:hypothetical protein